MTSEWTTPVTAQFPDFWDAFDELPSGALTLNDIRTAPFCIYEDRRIVVFYAPFDYVNLDARVALVGVTPGPTQMLASYEVVRVALRAGRSQEEALRAVKARASFKGMRRDLARWLDELGLATVLDLRSCSELFDDSHRALLHTTSAVRYPVFVRSRDGSLRNYAGSSPRLVAHPWLRGMVETTLASELSLLRSAIVVPLGGARNAIEHLCELGTLDRARCLIGLPHPSAASPGRERYFKAARTDLISQLQRLDLDEGRVPPRRPPPGHRRQSSAPTPRAGSIPEGSADRIVIPLTQGNLAHNHIYLRKHLGFFPADAVGAANARNGQGSLLTLRFEGFPEPVQTDIAGDKNIFRCRGDVGRFFARHALAEGNNVVIERLSAYKYRLRPAR